MSPLDRKLLRDLWRIKGQTIAIGLVIAVGVMMLVMMSGLVNSLDETRRTYYERYRLADVFAPVVRAPDRLIDDLTAIPGVASVEGRVIGSALIDIDTLELPIRAQAVSLPNIGAPRLNDIYLTDGRRLDTDHPDEILLLQGFAKAHDLKPGDNLSATMNGARRKLRIVGLAQSPEFLFTTPPGEIAPDDFRYAVIWMSDAALSAAYDMNGAFNEALLALERNTELSGVLDAIDRILERYGGQGAFGLQDQVSNRFITDEIEGMRSMSIAVPPIFLAVAAFLLYIVISRIVQSEREQIGLIKAFGYSDFETGLHYFKLVLVIAIGGAAAGAVMGVVAGRALTVVYQAYYKFPFLLFEVDPLAFVTGIFVSVVTASAGGLIVLRRVFALAPAVAMRPPAPADYRNTGGFGHGLQNMLDQPSRMVMRRLIREPGRMAGAVIGIAAGMALSVAMISILSGFNRTIDLTFNVIDRSDLTVIFTRPISDKTIFELKRMDGVIEVEPVRIVPAILRNGRNSYRGAINGLVTMPRLNRAVNDKVAPIEMRRDGIILASPLAKILDIRPGELLNVEIRQGRRPVLNIPVAGVAETLLGSPAYYDLNALNRALMEPGLVSGAYVRIDSNKSDSIFRALKNMPSVAGVSLKDETRDALQTLMDSSSGALRYVMMLIAGLITFGIVYNSARIAYAERSRDLASLRVIGFTRAETAFVLLGELAIVTLVALPIGSLLGYYMSFAISAGFSTDLYQIPAIFSPGSYGTAALAVIISAIASGWLVKIDLDRADLVSALKTKE